METTHILIIRDVRRDGDLWHVVTEPDGGEVRDTVHRTRGDAMTYLFQYTVAAASRRFTLTTEEVRANIEADSHA
jgi:hypothetical protein